MGVSAKGSGLSELVPCCFRRVDIRRLMLQGQGSEQAKIQPPRAHWPLASIGLDPQNPTTEVQWGPARKLFTALSSLRILNHPDLQFWFACLLCASRECRDRACSRPPWLACARGGRRRCELARASGRARSSGEQLGHGGLEGSTGVGRRSSSQLRLNPAAAVVVLLLVSSL